MHVCASLHSTVLWSSQIRHHQCQCEWKWIGTHRIAMVALDWYLSSPCTDLASRQAELYHRGILSRLGSLDMWWLCLLLPQHLGKDCSVWFEYLWSHCKPQASQFWLRLYGPQSHSKWQETCLSKKSRTVSKFLWTRGLGASTLLQLCRSSGNCRLLQLASSIRA